MTKQLTVIKRDDKVVPYDSAKIIKVIKEAAKNSKEVITEEDYIKLSMYVTKKVSKLDCPIEVECIQNAVEEALMKYNFYETEKCFHDYRYDHEKRRLRKNATIKEMNDKMAGKVDIRDNANVDSLSYGGRLKEMSSTYLKEDALDYRMSEAQAKAHRNFERYTHDIDSFSLGMHNCLSIPIDDLLLYGVNTRQVYLRSARSIGAACQLGAVDIQLQSLQQFGGVAFTHWDTSLVPYFRLSFMKAYIKAYIKNTSEFNKLNLTELMFMDTTEVIRVPFSWTDESGEIQSTIVSHIYSKNALDDWIEDRTEEYLQSMHVTEEDFYLGNESLDPVLYQSALYDTIIETKQGIESFLHNLNSLQSRSGNQLPFSSINYGCDSTEEGRIITKAILDCTIRGTGKGQTSIFPCQIFQLKDGINTSPSEPNWDLFQRALQSTAKRMYPNYANCDWSTDVAGFKKSQEIKKHVLEILPEETIKELATLPISVQHTLGFEIIDDGVDKITFE